jgi:hypothetical protein
VLLGELARTFAAGSGSSPASTTPIGPLKSFRSSAEVPLASRARWASVFLTTT